MDCYKNPNINPPMHQSSHEFPCNKQTTWFTQAVNLPVITAALPCINLTSWLIISQHVIPRTITINSHKSLEILASLLVQAPFSEGFPTVMARDISCKYCTNKTPFRTCKIPSK